MGEAKQRRAAQIASIGVANDLRVEVFDLECWFLLVHLHSGGYAPEGHDASTSLAELVEALDLSDAYRMFLSESPGIADLKRQMISDGRSTVFSLRHGVANFFLDAVTKGKMHPDVSMALIPLIHRIKDAKSGAYKAPDAEVEESADEEPIEAPMTEQVA